MAIKNQSIVVTYFAWDTANSVGKTGDAANHTMYVSIDGVANAVDDTSSAEVDATNLQGHYQVTLTPGVVEVTLYEREFGTATLYERDFSNATLQEKP